VVVDWHEVWTHGYWGQYLGPLAGWIGWRVQRRCLRVPQRAFCFSQLHERRLRELGLKGELTRLEGQYAGPPAVSEPGAARPVVVFAGRHIPEKRVLAVAPAIARAREELPELRGEIYGDGPERAGVLKEIRELGLDGDVTAPGFVDGETLERALSSALCILRPSAREGYGQVVIEAAARGVPAVVVAGPDNAATELVEEGVSGMVAASTEPAELARSLVAIERAGSALRLSTLEWFRRNAERLSLERSLKIVSESYSDGVSARS
jgi:glycosyltransferase involved in cell wall biosynthesis